MTVQVLLFAGLRDLAGAEEVTVVLTPGATVGDLRRALAAAYPDLFPLAERSQIAVNHEFVDVECVIDHNDEVALIPPVSGG